MPKCKWCGEKFDRDDLTARGYCEECDKKLRDDILTNKKKLENLKDISSSDLSDAEKQEIVAEAEKTYKTLREYKDKKVAFFKSDIEGPRLAIYKNLAWQLPKQSPRKGIRFIFILLALAFFLIGAYVYNFSNPNYLPLTENIPIDNFSFNISNEEMEYRFKSLTSENLKESNYTYAYQNDDNALVYNLESRVKLMLIQSDMKDHIDKAVLYYQINNMGDLLTFIDTGNAVSTLTSYAHALINVVSPSQSDIITNSFDQKIYPNLLKSEISLVSVGDISLSSSFDGENISISIFVTDSKCYLDAKKEEENYLAKNLTNASKTRAFSKELSSGHYTIGVDIPSGIYKFTAVKGGGNVFAPGFSEIMGVPSKNEGYTVYTEKAEDVVLQNGDILTISGVRLGISASSASADSLQERGQSITETVTLKPNLSYVSGSDFDPGIYCIEVVSGSGNVWTENGDDLGMSIIMGTDDKNSADMPDLYEQQFNNVSLPDRTILYVGDVTIKLIPSK